MSDIKKPLAPVFEMFEIKVEAMVPCSFVYRIRAETPEDAIKKIDKHHPTQFTPHNVRKKMTKATVYNSGTLTVRATKYFR
jgi:hypothetical protein